MKLRTILVHFSFLLSVVFVFAVLVHAQGTVTAAVQTGQGSGVSNGSVNGTVRVESTSTMGGMVGSFFLPIAFPASRFRRTYLKKRTSSWRMETISTMKTMAGFSVTPRGGRVRKLKCSGSAPEATRWCILRSWIPWKGASSCWIPGIRQQ